MLGCHVVDADAARVRALAAYKDFIALWKDADPDPDIPILKEAKAEHATLQQWDRQRIAPLTARITPP